MLLHKSKMKKKGPLSTEETILMHLLPEAMHRVWLSLLIRSRRELQANYTVQGGNGGADALRRFLLICFQSKHTRFTLVLFMSTGDCAISDVKASGVSSYKLKTLVFISH